MTTYLVYEIRDNLARNKCVMTANIDLENAYNSVQIPILIKLLFELKLPKRFIVQMHNLISDRNIILR